MLDHRLTTSVLANLSEISRYSRNYGNPRTYAILFSVLAIVAVVAGLIYIFSKIARQQTPTKRKSIEISPLLQIADALRLNSAELNLIKSLATDNGIEPPEVMFVDPGLWRECLSHQPELAVEVESLMLKLFGSTMTETV